MSGSKIRKSDLRKTLLDDFEEELDKIEQFKKRKHLDYDILASLYHLLLTKKYMWIDDIPKHLYEDYNIKAPFETKSPYISRRTLAKYITIIIDIDDFHRSFKFDVNGYEGWCILYATKIEAELCKKRHISLYKFKIEMGPILEEFHAEARVYYEKRKNMEKPPERMRDMKARYEKIIKNKFGRSIKASKFIRTEQDLVLLEFGDSRKAFIKEVYDE